MQNQSLHDCLKNDLKAIGLDLDFKLILKPYNKKFYALYNPNSNKVFLYLYEDKEQKIPYSYSEIFLQLVHECIHCMQYQSGNYFRYKGIMHDPEFYRLCNKYQDIARAHLYLRGEM